MNPDTLPVDAENPPRQALVIFTPSGQRGWFSIGTPLLQAARHLGVDIDSVCGGRGLCGRCQIELSEGSFPKFAITVHPEHVSPISPREQRYHKVRGLAPTRRLSCSTLIQGDLVIDVPAESQVHKQIVRKREEVRNIALDPVTRLHYIEITEPTMEQPRGDLERVYEALEEQWGLTDLTCDLRVLRYLQSVLRKGNWTATVAVHARIGVGQPQIISVWPGFHDRAYGVAIDVGSTTIAAALTNLASGKIVAQDGVMNPQIRFGEDLMSRVSYVMLNPQGCSRLHESVIAALNSLIADLVQEAGINNEDVLEAVLVGNPVMHHLFLGIDPSELGGAPFALTTSGALTRPAEEIGLALSGGARIYVPPCIAGHVGADSAAVVLSETPYLSEEPVLIVDIGTNAEIILGNRYRLLAASSPTGPAFEGAQISCGRRAAPGAVERVRIDYETLKPRFKIIGSDLWSDEDGFDAEALAVGGVSGLCGSGLIEIVAELFLASVIRSDGIIQGDHPSNSPRLQREERTYRYILYEAASEHSGGSDIFLTQTDIRAVQLAKAALFAGIRLLMDALELEQIERITLAGAFGSHIDGVYAMAIGLIPDCPPDRVHSAGNAAGVGARIALLNGRARDEIERMARRIEKIETAIAPSFQQHFVAAMAFPHAEIPFPHLSKVVNLPPPKGIITSSRRRRTARTATASASVQRAP